MHISHNPSKGPATGGEYSQGIEVATPGRLLHISGQIPEDPSGRSPKDFDAQCEQVWANVRAVLESAGMTTADLLKVTTFLSDRDHRAANSRIRQRVLGNAQPALTVIITGIYDERWMLEIETVAYQSRCG